MFFKRDVTRYSFLFGKGVLRWFLLCLMVFMTTAPSLAEDSGPLEIPEGKISDDAVWSGEYIVTGLVSVEAGATLTVMPGSRVTFRGKEARLMVSGVLVAEGSEEELITFTGGPRSVEEGKWGGIMLQSAVKSARFSNCTFSGAETALRSFS